MRSTFWTATGTLLAAYPAFVAAYCTDYYIPVNVTGVQNRVVLALGDDLSTISGVESLLSSGLGGLGQLLGGLLATGGTYQIAASYCPPHKISNATLQAQRAGEVQFLVHGIPYHKSYWFGFEVTSTDPEGGQPYSWVDYAVNQGYPVIAIDNLGAGYSDKPDPVSIVQQAMQTEIIHKIAEGLVSPSGLYVTGFYNEQPFNLPKAEKVIFVGHSLGSVIGNAIATKYATDFAAMILTGYSYTLLEAAVGVLLGILAPASLQNPAKYGDQDEDLPPAYLTFTSLQGKNDAYYDFPGSFNYSYAEYDFIHEDTVTLGQLLTAFDGLQEAADYTGDVLVLTGQNDALYCGPTGTRALGEQSCGTGPDSILAKTGSFFPKANYNYYAVNDTAHATNLHYSAQEVFEEAHAFLAKSGY